MYNDALRMSSSRILDSIYRDSDHGDGSPSAPLKPEEEIPGAGANSDQISSQVLASPETFRSLDGGSLDRNDRSRNNGGQALAFKNNFFREEFKVSEI